MLQDFIFILRWWTVLFGIGLLFLPLTKLLFKNSPDTFYIFSKILGIGVIVYILFVLGTLHILPFSFWSIIAVLFISLLLNLYIFKKHLNLTKPKISKIIVFEEVLFLVGIIFWSYIRAHEPSIHTLEKFMDFGFVNSILRTDYFPPKDMWFTPFSINYYFFGHLLTAMLTKLSMIPSNITYNLMIATLFAFTLTGGFSLLYNLLSGFSKKVSILGGIMCGLLLSFSGNLHTIYTLFSPYAGEKPVPPWNLTFLPNLYPNSYWYPNATRFIPFTIHEFPIYSFVVSDLHGHVIDIPFVLTTLALLFSILQDKKITKLKGVILSFLLALMYMTNVWDGLIYFLLTMLILIYMHGSKLTGKFHFKSKKLKQFLFDITYEGGLLALLFVVFTLPFSIFFKPFVSGIGILCAPKFLTDIGRFGPLLFEPNHCQHSPLYQLFILYGFFAFFAFFFIVFIFKKSRSSLSSKFNSSNIFVLLLILLGFLLILVPEFLYAKDIYPAHFRANTMFKLVYQSFILLTLTSTYSIFYLSISLKKSLLKKIFLVLTFLFLTLVLIYPYFAISSYYGKLKTYTGLNGTTYLKTLLPGDLEAISYLNKTVKGQPVILEAQGDSYTDYARISANTGLPTVLGWTVHEWLWRGSYDIPSPRIEEVKKIYEGEIQDSLPYINKYLIKYVVVGKKELEKYPGLKEDKFEKLGKKIFESSNQKTKIYLLN